MFTRLTFLLLLAICCALTQSNAPELPYQVDPEWPQLPAGWNFGETPAVAVDSNEHVYVFHRGPHPIIEFDRTGKFIRAWGDGTFDSPHGLRVDREGYLWAVDNVGHTVVKMNQQGRAIMVLGRRGLSGLAEDRFDGPTDVAFAPNGDFYVSDGYGNSRVVKFSKEGEFLLSWGRKGQAEGAFNLPHAVALDKRGRVYVGDRENHRIQIFDGDGKFLQQWKHVGSPFGLSMTEDGALFMADGYANRVVKLNLEGQILGVLGGPGKLPGQLGVPHHLSVSPAGDIYVAELTTWRAQRFVRR